MLWCYVMGIPKYSQIAVELLRRIRSGVYQDKLPPMRELAVEFDTAMQTVFNAVQLLVRKELLVPCGSGGMNIDRSKLPCGLIAIVVHNAMLPRVAAFEPLAQAISDDGFLPVYLGVLRKQSLYTAKKLFQADISGVMFFYSTINPEYCEVLDSQKIPYVSANILHGVQHVNFVESNTFDAIEDLVKMLHVKGYRRIAININSPLEGYIRYFNTRWRKILKKYNMIYSSYNSLCEASPLQGECESWDDIVAEPLPDKGVLPEAVINWNSSGIRCIKQYQGTGVLQLLNTHTVREEYIPKDAVRFKTIADIKQQWQELWNLLLSMLMGGGGKAVHHFLDNINLCMYDEIPNIKEQVKK